MLTLSAQVTYSYVIKDLDTYIVMLFPRYLFVILKHSLQKYLKILKKCSLLTNSG